MNDYIIAFGSIAVCVAMVLTMLIKGASKW